MLTSEQKVRVIDFLNHNFTLPKKGFIAGQAVASLIYRELGLDIPFFVNDVDVFIREDTLKTDFPCEPKNFLTKINGSSFHCLGSNHQRYYQVTSSKYSKNDPSVNLITYISSNYNDIKLHYLDFLGAFDFNCCAVGFDIETQEFYFHDAFIFFLNTKQLSVLSTFTPYHSILRLFKKINDLQNVHCDIETELRILGAGTYCISKVIVGHRFQELFNKMETKYKDYFDFEPYEHKYNIVKLKESFFNDFKVPNLSLNIFDHLKKNNPSYYFFACNPISNVNLYHILNETNLFKKTYREKISSFIFKDPAYLSYYLNQIGNNSFKKLNNINEKELKPLSKLRKEHNYLFHLDDFVYHPHLLNLAKRMTQIPKSDIFLIGLVENGQIDINFLYELLLSDNYDYLVKQIKNKLQNGDIRKIFNDFKIFDIEIKQLNSYSRFFEESQVMKHCILGYYSIATIAERNLFYFSIITREGRSTLEIKILKDNNISVKQHLSTRNTPISKRNKEIENKLIKYLKFKIKIGLLKRKDPKIVLSDYENNNIFN